MEQGSHLIGHHLLMSSVNNEQTTACAHLVQSNPNSQLDANGTPKTSLKTSVLPLS